MGQHRGQQAQQQTRRAADQTQEARTIGRRTEDPYEAMQELLGSRAASRQLRSEMQQGILASPLQQKVQKISPVSPRVQGKPMFRGISHEWGGAASGLVVQPKLTIGTPNEKYEQEADRVAEQVVQRLQVPQPIAPNLERRLPQPQAEQRETLPEADELQMQTLSGLGQRVGISEDDELQMKSMLQRETDPEEEDELQMKSMSLSRVPEGAMAVSADLEREIAQARGSGATIADTIREPMEQTFGGADFSGVKVHTDEQSDQLNRSIQAKAFTTGQDIFFRKGAYQPGSREGQELIAHELTHTLQQGAIQVSRAEQQDKTKRSGKTKVIHRRSSTPQIQRDVGFEFEDGSWRTWIWEFLLCGSRYAAGTETQGCRKARKGEVLHKGTGYEAQADYLDGQADLELVTDAFEETNAGEAKLKVALREMRALYKNLNKFVGKKEKEGEFAQGREVGFSNTYALLSQGKVDGAIKMQATTGIALEKLPGVMDTFGLPVGTETEEQRQERLPKRNFMWSPKKIEGKEQDAYGKILGQASAMADNALKLVGIPENKAGREKLRGFLALLLTSVRAYGTKSDTTTREDAAKHRLPFMYRTDMSKIFSLIPAELRGAVSDATPTMIDAIVTTANTFKNANLEQEYKPNAAVFAGIKRLIRGKMGKDVTFQQASTEVALPELTLEKWISGILDKNRPKDYATEANLPGFLTEFQASKGVVLDQNALKDRVQRVRGIGGLGPKVDKSSRGEEVPIFENRKLAPKYETKGKEIKLTIEEAVQYAEEYWKVMMEINHPKSD
jgi:hypothetical protein